MFLDVGLIDPAEGIHEHLIQRRGDVPHEGHQEEGNLEDRVLEKVQAINHRIVPLGVVHVHEEGENP